MSNIRKIAKCACLNISRRFVDEFSDVSLPDDVKVEILCKISREFFCKMFYEENWNTDEYKRLYECIPKKVENDIKLSDIMDVYNRVFKGYSDFFNNLDEMLLNEYFDGYKCSHLYNFSGDVGSDIERFKIIWTDEKYRIVKERLSCEVDEEFYEYLEYSNYHSYDSYCLLERYNILEEYYGSI